MRSLDNYYGELDILSRLRDSCHMRMIMAEGTRDEEASIIFYKEACDDFNKVMRKSLRESKAWQDQK